MRSLKLSSAVVVSLMTSTAIVSAADLLGPAPTFDPIPEVVPHAVGGWYIRGDIGYAHMKHNGVVYNQGGFLSGRFEQHELDSTWFLQGGIGYQVTDYMRFDGTIRYYGSSDFDGDSAPAGSVCAGVVGTTCDYNDDGELKSATVIMANFYADLGTYKSFTPYVGAGIGGAYVKYGNLFNDQTCAVAVAGCDDFDSNHAGEANWRFAWSIHAGASYDINCRLKADAGYTYTRIEEGAMFAGGVTTGAGTAVGGAGYDEGIDIHSGSIGLRYALDDSACHTFVPPVEPPIYK